MSVGRANWDVASQAGAGEGEGCVKTTACSSLTTASTSRAVKPESVLMDAAVLWQDFTGKHSCQMSKMEDCLDIPESECQESKIL